MVNYRMDQKTTRKQPEKGAIRRVALTERAMDR